MFGVGSGVSLPGVHIPGDSETPGDREPDASEPAAAKPTIIWTVGPAECGGDIGLGCNTAPECADDAEPVSVTGRDPETNAVLTFQIVCPEAVPAATPAVNIDGLVAAAFEKVPLPSSTLTLQPPGGKTLVNFPTIFSTTAARDTKEVPLDGVNVTVILEYWPSSFAWTHGDGTTQSTDHPGKAWTQGVDVDATTPGFVTHTYTALSDKLEASVDTTWSARFKVKGQDTDWRPVDGTVTKDGAVVNLAVLEATPQLVR